jgi:hypothetical protein
VARVLDLEERELARLDDAGMLPANLPPYEGGRVPADLSARP